MVEDESGKLDQLFSSVDGEQARDPANELKGQIAALLWEKRYEEALDLLYDARWHSPDAAEIPRGINLLKERLVRRYVEELGDLDAIPSIAPGVNRATIEIADEERALLHLIDGISSFTDIAHQSRLGRFETYRALARVVREGIVEGAPPPAPTPLPAPRRAGVSTRAELPTARPALQPTPRPEAVPVPAVAPSPAPPRHRWRGLLVGSVSFAITAVVGLTWWALTGTAPSLHPGAAVAGVPSPAPAGSTLVHHGEGSASPPGRPRASQPATPAPPGAPGARRVATLEPEAKLATPDASRSLGPVTVRRSSRSAATSEERSKKRSSQSRGAAAAELAATGRPRSSSTTPSGARAIGEPPLPSAAGSDDDASEAPSLPELPPGSPGIARPAVLAASSAPASSRAAANNSAQAPQGLVKASARSPAPASLAVAVSDLAVRGPLGRSVVEQAVARAQADFRACYASRAAFLRRDGTGTARVSLTIDEAGYATGVSAQGAPLPGLDGCLQEAAGRIRTRVHPDVGLATVTFGVVFSIGGSAR